MLYRLFFRCRQIVAVLWAIALLATVGQPAVTVAQSATPGPPAAGISFPTGVNVDLPAMVLLPGEIDPDFAAGGSGFSDAAALAADSGLPRDQIMRELNTTGFIGEYRFWGGVPDEADPAVLARTADSYVMLFQDSEGAEHAFNLLGDESTVVNAEDVATASQLGDQSELTRLEGILPDEGVDFVVLDYTFRVDNLVAGVSITSYDGNVLTVDAVMALARQQLDRIESVLAGDAPDLSLAAVRLESSNGHVRVGQTDQYRRIYGATPMSLGESPAAYDARVAYWGDANVETAYRSGSFLVPEGAPDATTGLTLTAYVYLFPSVDDAERFAANGAEHLAAAPGGYFTDVMVLDELPAVDGAVSGVSYGHPVGTSAATEGYGYWAQVGPAVVSIHADAPGGVTQEGVMALLREQISCVEMSEAPCQPVAVPANLMG